MKQRARVAKQQAIARQQAAHELERQLSMRGWDAQREEQRGFASLNQRHMAMGIGRHMPRCAFRGRGTS